MRRGRGVILLVLLLTFSGCGTGTAPGITEPGSTETASGAAVPVVTVPHVDDPDPDVPTVPADPAPALIDPEGMTLESRIRTPEGFIRTPAEEGSIGAYLRNYAMKPDGSPVLYYDGREKPGDHHAAVFTLPIEEEMQQCADSVMRVWGEYYYARGEYDRISFSLGDLTADFGKWSSGYTIRSDENDRLCWKSSDRNDGSYASFQRFMHLVFAYSGTVNMADDARHIELAELRIGDIFIKGGTPGHVVMVADTCVDGAGRVAFLLAQGYMPAQEFHVIRNPLHEADPWYYAEEVSYPFRTADYTFPEGSLRRYK